MTVERPHASWWLSILSGLGLLALVGYDDAAYAWWTAHVGGALSQPFLKRVFIAAVVTHVGEATYAYRLAQRSGCAAAAWGWFRQTLVLGFPSLRLLRRRVATVAAAPPRPR